MNCATPMFYFGLHWNPRMRVATSIILTDNELTRLSRSGRTSVRLAERSRIELLAAQGLQNKEIAEQLGVGRVQVARWRKTSEVSHALHAHLGIVVEHGRAVLS